MPINFVAYPHNRFSVIFVGWSRITVTYFMSFGEIRQMAIRESRKKMEN